MNDVYTNDDYCVLENDNFIFYYGYEYLVDKKGELFDSVDIDDDDDAQWAFVVKDIERGEIIGYYSTSYLEGCCGRIKGRMPHSYLMAGINEFINDGGFTEK